MTNYPSALGALVVGARVPSLSHFIQRIQNGDSAAWTTAVAVLAAVVGWYVWRRSQEDRIAPDGGE
ncbi:MAG: hypothetical protein AAF961_10035 [Planctomycetota bacterium]